MGGRGGGEGETRAAVVVGSVVLLFSSSLEVISSAVEGLVSLCGAVEEDSSADSTILASFWESSTAGFASTAASAMLMIELYWNDRKESIVNKNYLLLCRRNEGIVRTLEIALSNTVSKDSLQSFAVVDCLFWRACNNQVRAMDACHCFGKKLQP